MKEMFWTRYMEGVWSVHAIFQNVTLPAPWCACQPGSSLVTIFQGSRGGSLTKQGLIKSLATETGSISSSSPLPEGFHPFMTWLVPVATSSQPPKVTLLASTQVWLKGAFHPCYTENSESFRSFMPRARGRNEINISYIIVSFSSRSL